MVAYVLFLAVGIHWFTGTFRATGLGRSVVWDLVSKGVDRLLKGLLKEIYRVPERDLIGFRV